MVTSGDILTSEYLYETHDYENNEYLPVKYMKLKIIYKNYYKSSKILLVV